MFTTSFLQCMILIQFTMNTSIIVFLLLFMFSLKMLPHMFICWRLHINLVSGFVIG